MHKQKLLLSMMLVLLLLFVTACGEGSLGGNPQEDQDDQTNGSLPSEETPPLDEVNNNSEEHSEIDKSEGSVIYQHELILSVYYADMNVTHLQAIQTLVSYNELTELYQKIWLALQDVEEEQADIWGQIELNSIGLSEGLLTIDIQEPTDLFLGSSGEALGIQALIYTYSQVPDVQQIQLTIDGEIRETLTGHVSIDKPFELNEEIIKIDQ